MKPVLPEKNTTKSYIYKFNIRSSESKFSIIYA